MVWLPKLSWNKERDAANMAALRASGWGVLVIWECETRDIAALIAAASFPWAKGKAVTRQADVRGARAPSLLMESLAYSIGAEFLIPSRR